MLNRRSSRAGPSFTGLVPDPGILPDPFSCLLWGMCRGSWLSSRKHRAGARAAASTLLGDPRGPFHREPGWWQSDRLHVPAGPWGLLGFSSLGSLPRRGLPACPTLASASLQRGAAPGGVRSPAARSARSPGWCHAMGCLADASRP